MAINLNGKTIDWARPAGTPAGFETVAVVTGQQGSSASSAVELALSKWVKPETPSRDALGRLHTLRVNQRVTPVVLVVELPGGSALIFGPNPALAPTRPLPTDQAERILQAVLDEPTPVTARTRLASLLQSLETTSIPGVKNWPIRKP